MNDEAVGMLVRRFPAVTSVQFKVQFKEVSRGHLVTDKAVLVDSSHLPSHCSSFALV